MSQPKLLSEEQQQNFFKFYENAKYNEIIPPKYAHLIHSAVAMAIGCYPWMEVYFGVAEEMDISEEELAAVRSMVMAVTAGRIFHRSLGA